MTHDQGVTCLVLNDGTLLRTCHSYRHLGVVLSRTEHMAQEVATRIENMHVHYHPLARNVFLNEHLGEVVKLSLAKSLLWSVLFPRSWYLGAHWNMLDQEIGGCTGLCFARHVWELS